MMGNPTQDSLKMFRSLGIDEPLTYLDSSDLIDWVPFSVILEILRLADRCGANDSAREEMKGILESEAGTMSILIGQMIKSKRRLSAARDSLDFHEAHEQTLISEQRILMKELSLAASRLRVRISEYLSAK
ncbi:MAG TPA: hypothetical protein VEZ90_16545 [Blastocatellia bacterium]|nr:hypothetical protein [Blastocatellia bacterium]